MLEKLRDAADDILDLFAEYFELAEDAREEYHRILADIEKISKGVYVR